MRNADDDLISLYFHNFHNYSLVPPHGAIFKDKYEHLKFEKHQIF